MSALRIDRLCKSYGARAVLRDVSLEIAEGQLLAVLGASGSGKTTLLRAIAGFERIESGRIEIGGRLVSSADMHVPVESRGIGYVAQEGALFPHLDVAANVLFGLPRAARRDRARAHALLALVGLRADYADRPPSRLSGGEQQRVAVARALARRPSLVLLDEPFSALDAGLRIETREAVRAALAATGATGLLVTHDQSEALSLGDRVAVLREGRVAQIAAPAELYVNPADPELARFVGEAVLLPGFVEGDRAHCALGALLVSGENPPQGAAEILIRPEQIRIDVPEPAPTQDCSRAGQVNGAWVERVTYYGHDAAVALRLGDGTLVTARVAGHRAPAQGARVACIVEGAVVAWPQDSVSSDWQGQTASAAIRRA